MRFKTEPTARINTSHNTHNGRSRWRITQSGAWTMNGARAGPHRQTHFLAFPTLWGLSQTRSIFQLLKLTGTIPTRSLTPVLTSTLKPRLPLQLVGAGGV